MLKITYSLLFSNLVLSTCAIDLDFDDEIVEGEKYYVELQKKALSYGKCWKTAMSSLHTACKELTEDIQSRLALSFSNCFLEHAGVDPCLCASDVSMSDCLKNCSDRVFSTYTEFFTHTQSICHYLQHKEWQAEIIRTALLLTENSQKISKKLDESAQSQSKILGLQQAAITEQKKSIANGKILNAELIRSRESARDLYNEFKTTTYEQKLLLFEIFDKMKNLQNFVLGEFTGVYTAAYYLITATLVYISTSVPKTADARIWLILIISLNALSEKFLTSYTLRGIGTEVNPILTTELLYERIWLCRKVACLVCLVTLMVSYYRYKDYNAINNELLKEIQQQNVELQNFIRGLTFRESSPILKRPMGPPLVLQEKEEIFNSLVEKDNKLQSSPDATTQQTTIFHNKDGENKENSSFSAIHQAASPRDQKVTPKRKSSSVKKNSKARNKDRVPLMEENNLESPYSPSNRRYNLRSSSQFNSPLSSP